MGGASGLAALLFGRAQPATLLASTTAAAHAATHLPIPDLCTDR